MTIPDSLLASPDPIAVFGVAVARPGSEEELLRGLLGLVEPSRREQGCLYYGVWLDSVTVGGVAYFEHWASGSHFADHLAQPHVADLGSWMPQLLAGPLEPHFLTPSPTRP